MATAYNLRFVEGEATSGSWPLTVSITSQTDFVAQVFLLVTGTTNFARVATMEDLATFPVSSNNAYAYYRASTFTKAYASYDQANAARAAIAQSVDALATAYSDGVEDWGATYNVAGP
jgi:hypothetical protein